MINKLKFRVWDKKSKKIKPVVYIDFEYNRVDLKEIDGFNSINEFEEVEIMQSTGLKDKYRIEIFEGDIVNCGYLLDKNDEREEEIGVVKFLNSAFYVKFKNGTDLLFDIVDSCNDIEVIGNIYENKELLEVK